MAQTSYSSQPTLGVPGGKGNVGFDQVGTRVNLNANPIPAGVFVKESTALFNNGADVLSLATDPLAGVVVRSDARPVTGDSASLTGIQTVDTLSIFDCMEYGSVWVRAEQVMNPQDPVYVRFANGAGGAGATNQQGIVRKDSDTGTCRRVKGARVISNGLSAQAVQMVQLYFDKGIDQQPGDVVEFPFSHGSIAATTTAFIDLVQVDRQFVVDQVVYDNPTGFAQDAANTYKIGIQQGATVEAQWDTTTGQQGTLVADTPV